MTRTLERREYARKTVQMPLMYRDITRPKETRTTFAAGEVVELSLSGMRIKIPESFQLKSLLEIYIGDPETGRSFCGVVEVVRWVTEGPPFLIGVRTRMLRLM